jgi:hypothetical protein
MTDVSVMPGKKGAMISFSQSEENIMEALEAGCSQFHTHHRAFMRHEALTFLHISTFADRSARPLETRRVRRH